MTNTSTYQAYRQWVTEPIGERPKISVVIPAFNEEWRILPTIGAIATHMCSRGEPWELIVADDGSTDTTVELLTDLRLPSGAECLPRVANLSCSPMPTSRHPSSSSTRCWIG